MAALRAAIIPLLSKKACHVERPQGERHLLPGFGAGAFGRHQIIGKKHFRGIITTPRNSWHGLSYRIKFIP